MRKAFLPAFLFACICANAPVGAILSQSGFNAVALKFNTGESVTDTPLGVHADVGMVNEGGVNLMIIDGVIPVYLTEGPDAGGVVQFGFADSAVWTPANADGLDLGGADTGDNGDRVFATVDGAGNISLVSADKFSLGVVIDSGSVTLDPNKPFELDVDPVGQWARVFYGGELVLQGDPFPASPEAADVADLGDDFVISLVAGPADTGSVTVNNLARDPRLAVDGFPRVLRHLAIQPTIPVTRPGDFLMPHEEAEVIVPLINLGSSTAAGVTAELSLPPGVGLSVVGPAAQSYGDIPSGASTSRRFTVQTDSTPVGVHSLTLALTGASPPSLETWVPVFDVAVNVTNLASGEADITADTPYGQHTVSITAPERTDASGHPTHFDIQRISHRIVHAEPFHGLHWGDAALIGAVQIMSLPGRLQGEPGSLGGFVNCIGHPTHGLGRARVTITNRATGEKRTKFTDDKGANDAGTGAYLFDNLPPGQYSIRVEPPASLKGVLNPNQTPPGVYFEVKPGQLTVVPAFEYVCPPPASRPRTTPPNGQGRTGTPPGRPIRPTNGKPASGESHTGRSFGVGLVVGVGLDAVDALLGPETFTLTWWLSAVAGNGGGGVAGVAADPQFEDIYYHCESMTPLVASNELTTEESVDITVTIDPPISLQAPSTVTTQYQYQRTTDQRTYMCSGTETLTADRYLPLTMTTDKLNYTSGDDIVVTVTPTTASGEPLRGGDVVVQALLFPDDFTTLHSNVLLQDDGQGVDAAANDGTYSGTLSTQNLAGGMTVYAFVSRHGFYEGQVPPSYGLKSEDIAVAPTSQLIVDYLLGLVTSSRGLDLNGDGQVDVADLVTLINP